MVHLGRKAKGVRHCVLAQPPPISAGAGSAPYVRSVSRVRFEWDPRKAKSNQQKHGMSFDEARSVFFDEQALLLEDPQPLHEEERFALL